MAFERCFDFSTSSRNHQSTRKSQFATDICFDFEDIEEDDDCEEVKGEYEYPCPFCSEDFDLVGLCCHLDDEHPDESTCGVCPVCLTRVTMNMVDHITTQHRNVLNISFLYRVTLENGRLYSALFSLWNFLSFLKTHFSYSKIRPSYIFNVEVMICRCYALLPLTRNFSWHKLKLYKGSSHSAISSLREELQNAHFQSLLARSSLPASSKMAPDPWLSFIFNTPTTGESENVQPDSSTKKIAVDKGSYEKALETNVQQPSMSDKDMEKSKRSEFVRELLFSSIMDEGL